MIQRVTARHATRVVLAPAIVLLPSPRPEVAEAPGPLLEARVVALSAADLEEAFWVCDYTATTVGTGATPVDLCSAVYDELKARKFGGEFELLLAWWRQNKPAEHARQAAETNRAQLLRKRGRVHISRHSKPNRMLDFALNAERCGRRNREKFPNCS